jgi:hypothetical protein
MEALNRRDHIRTLIAGATLLAMAKPALSNASETPGSSEAATDFQKRMDSIKIRELVESATRAARAEVEAQRAINAAQRASILLGAGSDAPYRKQASTHYETRTVQLRKTKDALARFTKTAADSAERHFAEFRDKGAMQKFTANARKTTVDLLLHSDISPDEARAAVKALDDRLSTVQQAQSFADLTSYLDHHLDELIERKMPDQDPNGLCVLLLILSSIFAVLVVIAALICVFTLGLGCSGILNQLLDQACP